MLFLRRFSSALRRFGFAFLTAGLAVLAVATPLLQLPGYELAELLTLFDALCAGPLALGALHRFEHGDRSQPGAQLAASVCGRLALSNAFVVAVVAARAALFSHCDPFAGSVFLLLLPVPTLVLGGILATGLVLAIPRRGVFLAVYFLGIALAFGHGAWPVYAGPQAFGYDHLLGYVPGPLYDENLQPPHALWLFRWLTLALAVALGAVLLRRPRTVPVLFVLALLGTDRLEHTIGTRSAVADLDRALGATRSFRGLTIHAPRELGSARLDELLRAAAVARAQVAQTLGLSADTPVDVFLYRSSEEKATLTGAGETHFTKPWLGQIQTELGAPQVLRHELVHALAGAVGGGPFGVGRKLVFDIGIIEGLAEAVDWPADRFTLDEWSAGLLATGGALAPADLLRNSAAFYAAPQGKAYTIAGAFLHWLLRTRGVAPVLALYRDEDFERAFGQPLAALSEAFERDLAKVPVSDDLRHATAERFRARPIFGRPCGREVAALRDSAQQAEGGGDHARAAELFGRCAALDPAEPSFLEARWKALRAAKDPAAGRVLSELLQSPATDAALRARVAMALGDDALEQGAAREAQVHFDEAKGFGLDPQTARGLHVRELAAPLPAVASAVHRYFDDHGDPLTLVGLAEAENGAPQFGPLPYLLGLALAGRDQPAWARTELDRALGLGLPDDLAAQAFRVEGDLALRLRDGPLGKRAVASLAVLPASAAQRRQAEDLESKLQLDRTLFPEVSASP